MPGFKGQSTTDLEVIGTFTVASPRVCCEDSVLMLRCLPEYTIHCITKQQEKAGSSKNGQTAQHETRNCKQHPLGRILADRNDVRSEYYGPSRDERWVGRRTWKKKSRRRHRLALISVNRGRKGKTKQKCKEQFSRGRRNDEGTWKEKASITNGLEQRTTDSKELECLKAVLKEASVGKGVMHERTTELRFIGC